MLDAVYCPRAVTVASVVATPWRQALGNLTASALMGCAGQWDDVLVFAQQALADVEALERGLLKGGGSARGRRRRSSKAVTFREPGEGSTEDRLRRTSYKCVHVACAPM